jgi:Cytidylate kinase-like family
MEPRASFQQMVERQCRRWEILRDHRAKEEKPAHWPLITIEREFGARGEALGRVVAEKSGFTFWDGELVHAVAEESGASETILRSLDEHRRNVIEESIQGALLGGRHMQSEYLRGLMRLLEAISSHGGSVVVGRGAQYILAPETALRVRVVSPLEVRVRGYAQRQSIEEGRARADVERSDAERLYFVRKLFSKDAAVASDYDLVVNTGTFDLEQASGIVLEAYGAKFGRRPAFAELRTPSVTDSAP